MLPLGTVICTTACAASVEGATMFTPLFALGFPRLGAEALTPGQAIATALIIESVGYSSGLTGHARQGTVLWSHARAMWALAVPGAAIGALLAHLVPGRYLLLGVAVVVGSLGTLLFRDGGVPTGDRGGAPRGDPEVAGSLAVCASDGRVYHCAPDPWPVVGRLLTSAGGLVTGLVGITIAEVTSSQLMLRLRWPARVAIGTAVSVVLPTVLTAGILQALLLHEAGLTVPWNLVVWTVPAVLIGGQAGSRVTRIVPEPVLRRAVAALFVLLAAIVAVSITI